MRTRSALIALAILSPALSAPQCILGQDAAEANRRIVNKVVPQYPALARAMKIQGSVRIDVLVDSSGKVKSIEVKGGHPILVQSAEAALHEWKWEPASHETHQVVELKFTP
jgi:protein TonB